MGGGMGVYEGDRHPFLGEEIRLLGEALAAGTPTLGVCLGSQLLAAAGEARVYRGEAGPEVGWLPSFEALHWHGDTFDLSPGARHLASSALYVHQAFRLGSALGLQFHVEATAELARGWMLDPDLPASWRPPAGHLERTEEAAARMAPLAASLARAFAAAVLRQRGLRPGVG
jgi:GMP synthase (glutamine-hydrolysing)